MRSRYAAFALRDTEYLRTTWHPSTRPDPLDLDADVRWRRLDILGTAAGGRTDATGEVEFRAFWSTPPAPDRARSGGVLHERSRFRRESDRLYYVDGDILD
jgi:SEC-C motif-containing protein